MPVGPAAVASNTLVLTASKGTLDKQKNFIKCVVSLRTSTPNSHNLIVDGCGIGVQYQ